MAATFELKYPASGPYTASWLPSRDPLIAGSEFEERTGIIAERMADAFTQYGYRISAAHTVYRYVFNNLTDTDRSNLITFQATVGSGIFDFKEGSCGIITSYRDVTFVPENFRRTWRRVGGTLWGVTVVLVDAS
jgi:hypothetical protein